MEGITWVVEGPGGPPPYRERCPECQSSVGRSESPITTSRRPPGTRSRIGRTRRRLAWSGLARQPLATRPRHRQVEHASLTSGGRPEFWPGFLGARYTPRTRGFWGVRHPAGLSHSGHHTVSESGG